MAYNDQDNLYVNKEEDPPNAKQNQIFKNKGCDMLRSRTSRLVPSRTIRWAMMRTMC